MSQSNVLPNGGEIHFKGDKEPHSCDRIEFLPGGWVLAIYKKQYELIVHPMDSIERIYTYTKHLEDEDWW